MQDSIAPFKIKPKNFQALDRTLVLGTGKFQLARKEIIFIYFYLFVLISTPSSSPERIKTKEKLLMFLASGVVLTWEPLNNMQIFLCYRAFLSILSAVHCQTILVSCWGGLFKVFIFKLFNSCHLPHSFLSQKTFVFILTRLLGSPLTAVENFRARINYGGVTRHFSASLCKSTPLCRARAEHADTALRN